MFSSAARQWLAAVTGWDAQALTFARLQGSTSSSVYLVRSEGHATPEQTITTPLSRPPLPASHSGSPVPRSASRAPRSAVLRLFDNRQWLAEEPDLAEHEAAALTEAIGAGLSAPRLLAHAGEEAGFGASVVVMSYLPGTVVLPSPSVAGLDEAYAGSGVTPRRRVMPPSLPVAETDSGGVAAFGGGQSTPGFPAVAAAGAGDVFTPIEPHGVGAVPASAEADARGQRTRADSRLDGSDPFTAWLDGLAYTLAAIHRHPAGEFGWRYRSWVQWPRVAVPDWAGQPGLWQRAIELARGGVPDVPSVFIHRDYHPTNVLWEDGVVSGVVDWVNACRGPAGVDVAHCRSNLAKMYGPAAAERFLVAYCRAAPDYVHYPYWDVDSLLDTSLPEPHFYPPWQDFGLPVIAGDLLRWRVEEHLAAVLA